jgi:teichoic acid transport system ATP-binding protein
VAEPMVVADNLHIVYRVYGAGGDRGTAATALLRIMGRKTRGSIREVHAIRGMSFVAYRGDAVGVIGRNGSGKSTLLRAIAGLLPAEQGNIFTTGEASLLGVNAALMDDLTGERNVILGCLAMGMTRQEAKDKYQEIVDFSGVGEFIDLPMRTYSSGMGARLRFAIAAAKSHDVLLVDEALATGDAEFRVKSHARIQELRDQAGTVFLVAHNLEEVEETCNRVIWMERGRLVMEGDDVTGIIDKYIAASGGQPVMRDPETGHRLGGRQHAARSGPAAQGKAAAQGKPAKDGKPAAKDKPAAPKDPAPKDRAAARK